MRNYIIGCVIGLFVGILYTSLIFNKLLTSQHNSNRKLYNVLNQCDQSLKKTSNIIQEYKNEKL